jgi:hypothetical protein
MTLWEERAARNEAVFREVNERVRELHDDSRNHRSAEFVCECADDACTERIDLGLDAYERVRQNPHHFIVRPGHERPDIERVVEEGHGFLIVSKDDPVVARIAEQTDPRR